MPAVPPATVAKVGLVTAISGTGASCRTPLARPATIRLISSMPALWAASSASSRADTPRSSHTLTAPSRSSLCTWNIGSWSLSPSYLIAATTSSVWAQVAASAWMQGDQPGWPGLSEPPASRPGKSAARPTQPACWQSPSLTRNDSLRAADSPSSLVAVLPRPSSSQVQLGVLQFTYNLHKQEIYH